MSTTSYREQFATLPAEGPAWLAPLRARAMAQLEEHGFPTPRNEDWHFTNPAPITTTPFEPMGGATGTVTQADLLPFTVGHAEWPMMVFVNGRYAPSLSRVGTLPDGVRLISLASALHEEPTLLERYLGKYASIEGQAYAFGALNTAMMRDGAVLHVPKDTTVDTPIHLLFVTDAGGEGGVSYPRNLARRRAGCAGHGDRAVRLARRGALPHRCGDRVRARRRGDAAPLQAAARGARRRSTWDRSRRGRSATRTSSRSPSPRAPRWRAATSTRRLPARGAGRRSTGCTCSTASR